MPGTLPRRYKIKTPTRENDAWGTRAILPIGVE